MSQSISFVKSHQFILLLSSWLTLAPGMGPFVFRLPVLLLTFSRLKVVNNYHLRILHFAPTFLTHLEKGNVKINIQFPFCKNLSSKISK